MTSRNRIFYGWIVVAVSALGLIFGAFPIGFASFAIFFRSYLQEFHASRAAISLALTIHSCFAALLAGWIGRLADRFGARKVILAGSAILALVLLSAEAIGSRIWQLYLFYAVLGAVAGATTSVPYGLLVSRWFDRHRGLALGLSNAGLGVGAMVMPPLVRILIAHYGWRSAFAIVGGAILTVAVTLVGLFLKEANGTAAAESMPLQHEGLAWGEIRKCGTFWLMTSAFVLAAASIQACITHMAEIFSERGADAALAALAISVVGLAALVGRAGTGFLLDRYFGPHVALSMFALSALGIALLWMGPSVRSRCWAPFWWDSRLAPKSISWHTCSAGILDCARSAPRLVSSSGHLFWRAVSVCSSWEPQPIVRTLIRLRSQAASLRWQSQPRS
jgi:MFS family permease